jgi:N-acetyltransferase 10
VQLAGLKKHTYGDEDSEEQNKNETDAF